MLFIKKYTNNNKQSNAYGKTYGKVVHMGTQELDDVVAKIEEKCTVHEADVRAVLTALRSVVAESIQNSYRVHLPGLGFFKLMVRTKGEEKPENFIPQQNILRTHVVFQPEKTLDSGHYTNPLTRGVHFKIYGGSTADADEGDTTGGSTSGGSDSGQGETPVENRP